MMMTLRRCRFLPLLSSVLVLSLSAPLLRAEDARLRMDRVETTDGHVYTDVVIQKNLPDRIVFMHAEGAATVALDKLTPETLHQLRPEKAEAEKEQTSSGPSVLADAFVPPYPLKLESLVTLDGQTYHDVVITNVGVLELSFHHAQGSASVPFARLPEGVQHEYLYDPAKAETYLQEVKALLEKQQESKKDDEISRLRREAAAAREAAEKAKRGAVVSEGGEGVPSSNGNGAQVAAGSLVGVWKRNLGKGQTALKTYGFGRISASIYDSKGKLINQNGGAWSEGNGESIEKLQYASEGWINLIGKTIRHRVQFPRANAMRLIGDGGNMEEWTRMP